MWTGEYLPRHFHPYQILLESYGFWPQNLQGSDFSVAVASLKEPRPAAGEFSIHFGVLPAAAKHCSAAGASSKIAPWATYTPPPTISQTVLRHHPCS